MKDSFRTDSTQTPGPNVVAKAATPTGYMAFISYRHADNKEEDRQWATWLHQQLEVYDIPAELIGTKNIRGEPIPERIYPVFRDEVSLPADADLSSAITEALDESRFLVVLCSPRAVQSKYLSDEIFHFKASGKADRVIAALLLGEPNASIDPGKDEDPEDARTLECFPAPLRYEVNAGGELELDKPTEPLAADFRLPDGSKGLTSPTVYKQQLWESGRSASEAQRLADAYEEKLSTAKLKIIAGILGVRLDTLTARDKLHQLKKERARTRRAWRLGVAMATLFVAAAAGAVFAWFQYKEAEEERDIAERSVARYFATEATRLDARKYGPLGVLLGIEAYRLDLTTRTDEALRSALSNHLWEPLPGHDGRVIDIALSSDGRWLASAGVDKSIRLWDLESPDRSSRVVHAGSKRVPRIAIGGGRLAAAIDDKIQLWDLDDVQSPPVGLHSALRQVSALTIGVYGNYLAASGDGGVVRVWTLKTEKLSSIDLKGVDGDVHSLALSPNATWLAAGGPESRVALWRTDALNGRPRYLTSGQQEVYDVAFSGDSLWLASGGFEPLGGNSISIWSLNDLDAPPRPITKPFPKFGFGYSIGSIALGTNGDRILSGATDGVIRLTVPDNRKKDVEFAGLSNRIVAVAVSPKKWVAAAGDNGTIWLYDLRGGGMEPIVLSDEEGFVFALAPDKTGSRLVSGNADGSVRLHNTRRPIEAARRLLKTESRIRSIAQSQDNRWLAIGDEAGGLRLLDLDRADQKPIALSAGIGAVHRLQFDRNSHRLAVAGASGLRVYDIENLEKEPTVLEVAGNYIIALRFGDGDRFYAATSTNAILSWESPLIGPPSSRKELGGDASSTAAFSPDGLWFARSKDNNRFEVLQLEGLGAEPIVLSIPFEGKTFSAFGYPLLFSPDGKWLAFVGGDTNVWIWRVGEWFRPPFALRGHANHGVASVAFSDDGRWLASGGYDSVSRLWSLPDALLDRACLRSGRNLTLSEWRRYWGDRDYVRTCPEWPLPADLIGAAASAYVSGGDAADVIRRHRDAWEE